MAIARRLSRRQLLGAGVVGGIGALAMPSVAEAGCSSGLGLSNEGVGMYSDPSVANQTSSFSINQRMVSCGVGTLAIDTATGLPKSTGPFAMLMFALAIDSYKTDTTSVAATGGPGTMRSITRVGGGTVEDTTHAYIAIGFDGTFVSQPDRFDVHFKTPFWNTMNPMCTPSDKISGGCRFGGQLLMGDVVVGNTCGGLPA
jgi:hypothetical protein